MSYSKSRCKHHNYYGRSIYLITINKAPSTPVLSSLFGGLRASASVPGVTATPEGEIVKSCLRDIPHEFPEAKILQYVIMPDHIHLVIFIQRETDYHLGKLIGRFTGNCTRMSGRAVPFFETGFHDRILRNDGQLRRMIDYVRDNPRRLLIRREHPEYFRRRATIVISEREYPIYGNFLLLRNPSVSAVRISRSFSESELMARHIEWEETVRCGGVLVSPFISMAEKEVRDYAIREGGNLIIITREAFGERYKPPGRLFDLCADGRLLLLSTGAGGDASALSRKESLAMNTLAETIASDAGLTFRLKKVGQSGS